MRLSLQTASWSVLLLATALRAQRPEPIDEAANQILMKHGLEHSQVMEHLSWMCDVYGPRLTGSTNIRRAQDWAVKTLGSWGLVNAHTEPWGPFGRGWRCDHVAMEVIGDNPWPVIVYPKAWSASLSGRIEAEVFLAAGVSAEDIKDMDLSNKIVLLDEPRTVAEPFDGLSKRFDSTDLLGMADQAAASRPARAGAPAAGRPAGPEDPRKRQAMLRVLMSKKPLALVDRGGKGDYGTVFVQGATADPAAGGFGGGRGRRGGAGGPPEGSAGGAPVAGGAPAGGAPAGGPPGEGAAPQRPLNVRDKGVFVIPQFTMAVEHYNRMCRLLRKNLPVRVALELRTSYQEEELMDRNVVAEIPGTDPALGQQVVMVGGHFDSWHTGTGATDNGCGSAVAMEAVRLIRTLMQETGKTPRRTIRIALWSGEEQGLMGSRAYVREHFGELGADGPALKPEHAQLAAYFNLDNGTGKIRGVYLQGNEAVAPIFRAWLRPFHGLGASTLTLNNTGGTDHLSFDGVGLPGFQFIQDPVSYDTRTHHSNMDVWDHVVAEDLMQAATIEASFAWHAAQRDEMLPRPGPREGGGGRRGGNRGGRGGAPQGEAAPARGDRQGEAEARR